MHGGDDDGLGLSNASSNRVVVSATSDVVRRDHGTGRECEGGHEESLCDEHGDSGGKGRVCGVKRWCGGGPLSG